MRVYFYFVSETYPGVNNGSGDDDVIADSVIVNDNAALPDIGKFPFNICVHVDSSFYNKCQYSLDG